MRIIAGKLGGRQFDSPRGHRTHPMSEKMRGAIFNMLGNIDGLTVLDVCAGSGALGFEALSRGAVSVLAIDQDKHAYQTIVQNSKHLGLERTLKAVQASIGGWSANNFEVVFDIVLCDPPYDDIKQAVVTHAAAHTKPDGIFVLSIPPSADIDLDDSVFEQLAHKSYGDGELIFYRRH